MGSKQAADLCIGDSRWTCTYIQVYLTRIIYKEREKEMAQKRVIFKYRDREAPAFVDHDSSMSKMLKIASAVLGAKVEKISRLKGGGTTAVLHPRDVKNGDTLVCHCDSRSVSSRSGHSTNRSATDGAESFFPWCCSGR